MGRATARKGVVMGALTLSLPLGRTKPRQTPWINIHVSLAAETKESRESRNPADRRTRRQMASQMFRQNGGY